MSAHELTVRTDDGVDLHIEVDAARRLVRDAAPGRRSGTAVADEQLSG